MMPSAALAELTTREAKIATLTDERNAEPTECKRQRLQARISAEVTAVEKLAETVEQTALDELRAEYRFLCQATAKAALASARAKAKRDQAADRYYKAHAEYMALKDHADHLQHQVKIGFAMKLSADVRTHLAPAMHEARTRAGLQTAAQEARQTSERQYATAN
jgi:hypothetical protein